MLKKISFIHIIILAKNSNIKKSGNYMDRKTKKRMWIVVGLAVVVLIGIVVFLRLRNLRKQLDAKPVQKGESYERFDEERANDCIAKYFEGMASKDVEGLKEVFYSKDVLATFAKVNEMTEDAIIDSLKSELKNISLEYKELGIKEYSAYRESDVMGFNDEINKATGVSNLIKDMYAVSITFMQYTNIGWEEKNEMIRMYVIDDEYRIWPKTNDE